MIDALSLLDAFFIIRCEIEYPWSYELRNVDDGADSWMMSKDVSRACFERLIDIVNYPPLKWAGFCWDMLLLDAIRRRLLPFQILSSG